MKPDYKAIGKRIKSARIKAAMNQEELANQSVVPFLKSIASKRALPLLLL